jgi:hypothetical protein
VADAGFLVFEDLFGGQGIGRGWQHGSPSNRWFICVSLMNQSPMKKNCFLDLIHGYDRLKIMS